jgi:hypothetical protein
MAECILTEIEQKEGKLNQSIIYVFHWIDCETYDRYETIVDTTYRNYTRCKWNEIISSSKPLGIYGNLRITPAKTKRGKVIINADSKPEKITDMTMDEIIEVVEIRTQYDIKETMFDKLFEVLK